MIERYIMKQNKLFLVMIICIIFSLCLGCSEKKKEMSSERKSISMEKIQEGKKKSVKSKIDLLCLKYDVDSETLSNDLLEYLDSTDIMSMILKEQKSGKDINKLVNQMISGTIIENERLILMSKKHNVPISKISGIVYDYMIWKELDDIKENDHQE